MSGKIRVLIVDDSALMRQMMTHLLSSDPMIEVVGTAPDPIVAREKITRLHPDVLTLDIEMPRMDGLTFLEELMRFHPVPVVMVSSLTQVGHEVTLRALELGAVDFFPKPTMDKMHGVSHGAMQIVEKVKAAAQARIRPRSGVTMSPSPSRLQSAVNSAPRMTHQLLAIGASTGGTEALRELL